MVQQWIRSPFVHTRCTADDNNGRFLCECPGDGIAQTETSHTIRDTYCTNPVNAGVSVGGVSRTIFASAPDDLERALFEHSVELKDKITGDTENLRQPEILKSLDKVTADCQFRFCFCGWFGFCLCYTGFFSHVGPSIEI